MKNKNIAIIGAGTAGLATASFLQRDGHDVTLFEKFDSPKSLGAGLLLQPTGLSVLSLLGLDKDIITKGHIIRQLHGKIFGGRFTTLDVRYRDLAPHLFGVGTHRGHLFSALYEKALDCGVNIQPSSEIVKIEQKDNQVYLINKQGEKTNGYDILIDASGQNSILRKQYADIKLDKLYPYGAVWALVKPQKGIFTTDILEQRYKHAKHMIGILPVGEVNEEKNAAFFWSMRVADYAKWREHPFSDWQDYVIGLWPEAAPLVRQLTTHDDLVFATYRDVILRHYYKDNLVFMGDAAHCTSPQLGQGANLALMDALILSQSLAACDSIPQALALYDTQRKKQVYFYQMASRMPTPFFQSDSIFFAKLRFFACLLARKIPFARRLAAHVLTGTKTGLFSTLNPSDWAADYDLFKEASNNFIE